MNDFYLDIAARLGRTGLQIGGTWLATHGYMSSDEFSAVSGAVIAVITTGWTVYAAHKNAKANAPVVPQTDPKIGGLY